MKKTLSVMLVLTLMLGFSAALAEGGFDVDILRASDLCTYDRYNDSWTCEGRYENSDANSGIAFVFGTNSAMAGAGQPFMFRIYVTANGKACNATSVTFFLDDIRYDYSNIQALGSYSIINSGSVLRDMLNNLKNAAVISFRVNFSMDGQSYHIDVESNPSYFAGLIEIADLFERSNAWSIFADTVSLESLDQSNNAVKTVPEGAQEEAELPDTKAEAEPEGSAEETATEPESVDGDQQPAMTAEALLDVIHEAQMQLAVFTAEEGEHPLLFEKDGLSVYLERFEFFLSSLNNNRGFLNLYLRVFNNTTEDQKITMASCELNGWTVQTAGTVSSAANTRTKSERLQLQDVDTAADVLKEEDIETIRIVFHIESATSSVDTEPVELVMNPDTLTLFRAP